MTNKKHNYDWDAMEFDPDEDNVLTAFGWRCSPQGIDWWDRNAFNPEGQAEFARMKRLYAEDMAAKEGPVRTVTKKEIVPGVYGNVEISHHNEVYVSWMDIRKDRLDAAIETMIEIRDAMGE